MKCFRYNLNQNNQGPAGVLPNGSITGIVRNGLYYGAALIDNLDVLAAWNPIEITPVDFNTICTPAPTAEEPNPTPALVQLEPMIRQKFSNIIESIVTPYSIQERESWFVQLEEALKWQANNSIDPSLIPMIYTMATVRNQPISTVASVIIQKNIEYRVGIGTVLGQQQVLIQTIWAV